VLSWHKLFPAYCTNERTSREWILSYGDEEMTYKITINCIILKSDFHYVEAHKTVEIPFLPFAGLGVNTGDIWGSIVIGEPLFDNKRNIYGIRGVYYNPTQSIFDVYIGPDTVVRDISGISIESRYKLYDTDGWTIEKTLKEWEE
jgi:hypothetical protein